VAVTLNVALLPTYTEVDSGLHSIRGGPDTPSMVNVASLLVTEPVSLLTTTVYDPLTAGLALAIV
jgi:hypothetical protein